MDKQSSKSGSYVGGFFQLFDWKAKSRKKLFSSKSESLEHSKQGKRSEGNLPMTRLYLMNDDEAGMDYACHSNGGFSCASSVTDDDGSGSRGPSVVARLMGLDSMPLSISSDPYFTPFSDLQSLRDSHSYHRNLDYPNNYQVVCSRNFTSKMEGPVRHIAEEKPQIQRPTSRPIEKFQTEVLPPKSAKSIPITQHRLLSPIKSPGFIPSRDAAHIMEAAAKIIHPGQQHPITKGKMPMLVSLSSGNGRIRDGKYKEEQASHVLLRGQDIKEKIDAAQRTTSRLAEAPERSLGPNASKYLKGHSLNKSWNGLETSLFRASSDKEERSSSSRNKGKSVSLAVQAKANVQKRGGTTLSERILVSQRETGECKLGESFRSQSRASKNQQKRLTVSNSSGVLRQNNQKQNCTADKEKPPSEEPSLPNLQGRKALSVDAPARPKASSRSVGGSRVGLRRSEAMGGEKESTQHIPRKKRSIEGELQFNKIHVRDDASGDKSKKPVQSISKLNKLSTWAEDSRKNGMDVVSFTFTAPLARNMPGSGTSGQPTQKSTNCLGKRPYSQADNMRWTDGNNVLGGDALSVLLEQKLRELSNEVGPSCQDSLSRQSSSSSASPFQDMTTSTSNATNYLQKSQDSNISWPSGGSFGSDFNNGCFTTNAVPFKINNGIQISQGFDEARCDNKAKQLNFRHPSPSSVLEPPFSGESCFSSENMDSNFMEGNWQSLAQANEISGLSLQKKPHLLEADIDLSDSASSLLTRRATATRHRTPTMNASTSCWEICYVKEILGNIELMFKDFTLGRAREIINPHLFEQLEGRKVFKGGSGDSRLTRKVLFDCVSECMASRCRNFVGGGCGPWAKGLSMVRRKERLAEDIYKEIMDWRRLGDSMVDDLVDNDMRSMYRRWMEFEADGFVLGLEIEDDILDSLVDEAISTLLK